MTQPTSPVAGQIRTVPSEPGYQHDSARFWDVDECRWEAVTYPLLDYALEHCTATAPSGAPTGPETTR